jgi:hypothetical protein
MKITKGETTTTVNTTVQYQIEGVEPIKRRYSSITFIPDSLAVHLINGKLQTVGARGHRVVRSGQGAVASETWYSGGLDEAPQWIRDLVAATVAEVAVKPS